MFLLWNETIEMKTRGEKGRKGKEKVTAAVTSSPPEECAHSVERCVAAVDICCVVADLLSDICCVDCTKLFCADRAGWLSSAAEGSAARRPLLQLCSSSAATHNSRVESSAPLLSKARRSPSPSSSSSARPALPSPPHGKACLPWPLTRTRDGWTGSVAHSREWLKHLRRDPTTLVRVRGSAWSGQLG